MKLLMLDLEALIVDVDLILLYGKLPENDKDYVRTLKRNYAQEFVNYCINAFGRITLNTGMGREDSREIMAERFHIPEVGYWPYRSKYAAIDKYYLLKEFTLFHVDTDLPHIEVNTLKHLRMHYIHVKPVQDFLEKEGDTSTYNPQNDHELENAQKQIEAILIS